uniref:Cytochrome P450 family 8 subfamily B member 1, tandem duplicate 1 n=1 Tax=Scophthalmus maximus TaxID=52904 RepID=A0A8D3DDR8_SCOMX
MGLLLPILLGFLASLIGGLYLLGVFRQRQPGEPPLDKGLIPWLGHVLEFRRNTLKFLDRMKQKHGDVFTVQLGGFYITFLQDPLSFGAFIKESREKLDFGKFAKHLVHRVFGYLAEESELHSLQMLSNKHLKGDGLKVMTQAMMGNLQNLMLHSTGSDEDQSAWIETGLFMYSYNILFRAGYLSLYGNAPPKFEGSEDKAKKKDRDESEALFKEFRKYDQLFPNLAYGVLSPRERSEAQRLMELFWNSLSVQKMKIKDNISGWVWDMQQVREEKGMDESMINKFMFVLLWASQGNTGPAAFWLLLFLMKNPEAMRAVKEKGMDESMINKYMFVLLWASQGNTGPAAFWLLLFLMKNPEAIRAVKEEVDRVLKESGQKVQRGGPLVDLTHEMLLKTPILDSALEETLRLTAAPLLTRAVLQDLTLKMADGREYIIRKGDRMAMFPYSAVHIDPEIHPDPHSFKYDRFLNPDMSKKTDFYKEGKKVKYYNMPWGAGVSMCPGRFFATNEMKQFVFLKLAYFEIELKNPDEKIPEIDFRRWGFGSMQPDRDIDFRYRFRF